MPTAAPPRSKGAVPVASLLDSKPVSGLRKRLGGLLVTGFGPFYGHESNPSAELAVSSGFENRVLEVSFGGLRSFFDSLDPTEYEALLMIGVHGSATDFHLELLAHNWNGKHPDVHGETDEGEIIAGGPAILAGTLWPTLDLHEVLSDSPARLSYHPGSYFCNRIYYEALSLLPEMRVGFLHVPRASVLAMDRQKRTLSRLLERIVEGRPGDGRSVGRPRRRLGFP